jgi:hypothetical protein
MILNEIFKTPLISFGLGRTILTVPIGETVRIYQNSIYSEGKYRMSVNNERADNTSFIDFETTEEGAIGFQAEIIDLERGIDLKSNKITLIVTSSSS